MFVGIGSNPVDYRAIEDRLGNLRVAPDTAFALAGSQAHELECLIDETGRPVQLRLRVGLIRFDEITVDGETRCLGFLDEPPERDVRESIVDVSTPDIGVTACEPTLLEALITGGPAPHLGSEVVPLLVDGESLPGIPDALGRGVRDIEDPPGRGGLPGGVETRPEGHDRVPDAEELDGHGHHRLVGSTPVRGRHFVGPAGSAGPDVVEKEERSEIGIGFCRDAAQPVQKMGQGARLGGAPAEPENKDLVALAVVVGEESECLSHIALETGAPTSAEYAIGKAQQGVRSARVFDQGADSDVVVSDLRSLVGWVGG